MPSLQLQLKWAAPLGPAAGMRLRFWPRDATAESSDFPPGASILPYAEHSFSPPEENTLPRAVPTLVRLQRLA